MRQQQQQPGDAGDDDDGDHRGADDASQRFVLNDDAPYLANLGALWAVDPKLAAAIEALEESAVYPVEASKSGPPTVAVPTPDGRSIYLHSRYRPIDEAQKLIDP